MGRNLLKWCSALGLFGLVLLQSPSLQAAHLVGGQITYTCNGNNNYTITLKVYRDCNSSGALLDNSAIIGIFDGVNGNLISSHSVNRGAITQIPNSTGNPCMTAPPNLCTEYGVYSTTLNLPPSATGYVITYQRCCRNNTISNIYTPSQYGMTITTNIPANDSTCNSSPQWDNDPPIVLCQNVPLNIPVTTTDADGDSLHYRLCQLYHGGGQQNGQGFNSPAPNPPKGPPYTSIAYKPPSTNIHPIPGNPGLSIDSQTGYLHGTLSTQGQYVVAICVEEWRNGQLLSTIRRDYQFNVTNCNPALVADIISEVDDYTKLCVGTTVLFEEDCINATSYYWNFGDPSTLADTSRLASPSYTFNDTGVYTVMLVANPGWPCADTDIVDFHVYPPINGSWSRTGSLCYDVQNISLTAQGQWYDDVAFAWTIGQPGDANIYQDTNRTVGPLQFVSPGHYPVQLIITTKACVDTIIDTLGIYRRPDIQADLSSYIGCQPFTIEFDPDPIADTTLYYLWEFGDGDTSHAAVPTHTYTQAGTYDVKLWMWTTVGCIDTLYRHYPGAVTVHPVPQVTMNIQPPHVSIYQPEIEVTISQIGTYDQYEVFTGDGISYVQKDHFIHRYEDTGTFEVICVTVNEHGCYDTVTGTIRVDPTYNVYTPNAFTPDGDGLNESFRPFVTGFNSYRLVIANRWGQIVFDSEDATEGWNGRMKNIGDPCPDGVYSWSLWVRDFADSIDHQTGTVTLIR